MQTNPFTIAVADDALSDLQRRLEQTRWPDAIEGADWADGTEIALLRRLIGYWQTEFDWRAAEARLNTLTQYTAELDGLAIHFLHERGVGPSPVPLIITHGWPGTNFDMAQIIPLLTDPASHGADAADAFDVIAPAIPGYGFSQRPSRSGFGPARVAELWTDLMTGLGYERFGVQAADWGASISMWLAARFPDRVPGLHLNFIPGTYRPPLGDDQRPLSPDEEAFLTTAARWFASEGGYHHLQSTKPQTPTYALTDSPVGLAAWIVEKMHGWSDSHGDIESVFSFDQILTNISLYWFTTTIGSSMRFYRENNLHPVHFAAGQRVEAPLGVAQFPRDTMPPREWVERVFAVTHWTTMPTGGHFGALEAPDLLAEDIRAFFRPLRSRFAVPV